MVVTPIFTSITCVSCQSGMIVLGRALLQLLSCELNKLLFSQNTFFFFSLKRMSDRTTGKVSASKENCVLSIPHALLLRILWSYFTTW